MVTNGPPGVEKEELEKQKLQTEIEEIKLKIEQGKRRLDFEREDASKEHLRSWAAIIISIVTIGIGAITIGEKVYTFLSQNAQAQKVKINEEMIKLVKNLKTNDPIERTDWIMLLSAYEMEAVPVLLNNLEFSKDPDSIVESLNLIRKKKGVKDEDVLKALKEKAKTVFAKNLQRLRSINDSQPNMKHLTAEKSISNFITALIKLYGNKLEINGLLQNWKDEIQSRKPTVEDDTKKGLINILEDHRRKS